MSTSVIKSKYLIVVLYILSFQIKAQVYPAGTIFPFYYDINPDTVLNIIGNNSPTENYFIDIDNDLTNDFKMESAGGGGLGGGTHYINIAPLNSNSFVRFGRVDSVWHNYFSYWITTPMAKPLQLGDSINSLKSIWKSSALYITDNSGSAGTYTYPMDWIEANDLYIGVKYQNNIDTLYGWIRVNCPNAYRCTIKDYSASKCINACVGIKENEKQALVKVYPNPVSDQLFIESTNIDIENSVIEIIDSFGKAIIKMKFANQIDISRLNSGMYTVLIMGEQFMQLKIVME